MSRFYETQRAIVMFGDGLRMSGMRTLPAGARRSSRTVL
jgi:hypothetical protein